MIARVESVQNWLENLTHQMNNMVQLFVTSNNRGDGSHLLISQSYKEQASKLAG